MDDIIIGKHTNQERWDSIYRDVPPEKIPWHEGRPSRDLVSLVKNTMIKGPALDVCCGLGTSVIYLAKHGFSAHGIDISPTAINSAQKSAAHAGLTNARFSVGDVTMLDFPEVSFGFVMDRGCFHHIHPEERRKFIDSIVRVLKPNGRYHLTCFSELNDWPAHGAETRLPSRSDGLHCQRRSSPYKFSSKEIIDLFSKDLKILKMNRRTYTEKGSRNKVHFWSALMEKKRDEKCLINGKTLGTL